MNQITIQNFKGINMEEGQWQNGYARYCKGLDIFGLGDNPSKISYPGIAQCAKALSAETGALSGTSAITEQIIDFALHENNKFACGAANPIRIYRDDPPWKWISAISSENAGTVAAGVIDYSGNLYYSQKTYLGQYNHTTGASSSQFQTFSSATDDPRPMKIFSGSLFIGNNRYVAKYDGVTWAATKLTLPANYIVKSLEIYRDRLFISADNGRISNIFIWDGVSTTYEDALPLYDENVAPTLITDGNFLWVIPNRGAASVGVPIYIFNGSSFDRPFILPLKRDVQTGVGIYRGGILIGSEETSGTATYQDGIAGVWLIGRHSSNDPYSATLFLNSREEVVNKQFGAIYASGNTIEIGRVSTTSGTTYGIDELDSTSTNISGIWSSLPIDAGDPNNQKMWHSVKIEIEQDETIFSNTTISYRLDYASSFTSLYTYSTQANTKLEIPIRKRGKVIEIRVELTSASGVKSTRLHSITLNYSNTKK